MYFDEVAATYDEQFSYTEIGRLQRALIWNYLDKHFSAGQLSILEINCGTGEDAVFLANKGHSVLATDASAHMVKIVKHKAAQNSLASLRSEQISFDELNRLDADQFDLVFSDFGGLNCIPPSELKKLSDDISRVLKKGGRFVSVVMPKLCIWEQLYFLLKLDMTKAFRRIKGESESEKFAVWYYSPSEFEKLFQGRFKRKTLKPIGFFLPPSYLNSFFQRRPSFLAALKRGEQVITDISLLASFSDHYLIDLQSKA